MKLESMTWVEVETYLNGNRGIILPTGSTEQHGPLGLIGTDAICAREIAWAAADRCGAVVAPELAYAPAPFNMGFPGTVSLTSELFTALAGQVMASLAQHGFAKIYVLNGHGANLDCLRTALKGIDADVRVRSWWDFEGVNALRGAFYGDWEGMHATPSEVAITQHTHRVIKNADLGPPRKLTADYIKAHAGDKHGAPDAHRRDFPDGRVGSHSGLARPEHGTRLLETAAKEVAADYLAFVG
ncbi:creatininase family protein [Yoonia sediminilitoris]|uniref:Creatinine amidohydrolase n=1 Tax=Yoonia sediminilitoris TaxID=1286148 RepID=A0A2T6KIW3_9RHOB|nr:creatininase family protein [Yoonia sediminilitoris]PUB15665.1 creatinine amidohydrolase [Yoonia sediminilitoris]RCW96274.1 creatinine amidohydrolase [Yoonia sediminilitoris]